MRVFPQILALAAALSGVVQADEMTVAGPLRIGLVSGESQESVDKDFLPFTDYLASKVPGRRFRMVRLASIPDLLQAADQGRIDFAFCSPSAFVWLETGRNVRAIATVMRRMEGKGDFALMASAVFVRADSRIRRLEDARGRRVAGFAPLALGGWLAAAREWRKLGIDPNKDLGEVRFIDSYRGVADSVCSGRADIGILASEALASVAAACPGGFRVLPPSVVHGWGVEETPYPAEASSPAYPEQAFAVVGKADERLVSGIAVALLSIEPNSRPARQAGFSGFTSPLDYESVEEVMRELRVGPFKSYRKLTLLEAAQQNWIAFTAILTAFLGVLLSALIRTRRLNTEIGEAKLFRERIFEGLRIPLVVMDPLNGQFVECNEAATRIYGFSSRAETLAAGLDAVSAPSQADGSPSSGAATAHIRQAMEEGTAVFDWRNVRPDGEIWDAEMHLMRFQSGNRALLQFTLRDITTSRKLEERVRLLAQALHSAGESIGICDCNGTILYANRTFLSSYDYEEADLIGQPIDIVLSSDSDAPALQQGVWRGDLWHRSRGGREFPVSVATSAVLDDHGGHIADIWCIRDMTEYRALQAQYLSAQKLDSLGRLAGGIAHEFNNLLTIIMGYSRMMLGSVDEGRPFHEPVREIAVAATRAAELTRQVMAFSRREPGQPKLISLNDPIRNLQTMLQRLIGEDVELVVATEADPGIVLADSSQLEQILVNLVLNARDAMPDGGRLFVETANVSIADNLASLCLAAPFGNYVRLTVSDTGSGMTPAMQERIFDPFFTTKEQGHGSGLGLSAVYGMVRQMGGFIGVHSTPGLGTSLRILLPAMAAHVERRDSENADSPVCPGGTILLVEDESGVRKFIQEILEMEGYRVLDAANGPDAIELAKRIPIPIDLLLTDAVLPGMNGVEIAREVRLLRPGIAVLRMSGYTDRFGRQADPGTPFIQKPFSPEDLCRRVAGLLLAREPLDTKSLAAAQAN